MKHKTGLSGYSLLDLISEITQRFNNFTLLKNRQETIVLEQGDKDNQVKLDKLPVELDKDDYILVLTGNIRNEQV